ncbi:6-phosphogluconolactonase [Abditibacteriota bacterium]|nr:6-phosphogluconolactonase [Abditibacteriota bacterium]
MSPEIMIKHLSLLLVLGCLASIASARELADQTRQAPTLPVETMTLYIGTYTKNPQDGICVTHFNSGTGELTPAQTVAAIPNPSFLAVSPDGRFLYAVNEGGPVSGENKGGLSAFRIEPGADLLAPLNAIAEGGTLCHLAVDATGKWLLAAAYSAGTVSTWKIEADGSIGPRFAVSQHTGKGPNENRQSEPHAHHVVLSADNRRLFTADLGIDKVVIEDFNAETGELVAAATPFAGLAGGAGPRHLALSPSGQFLYVVSELNNTVTVFKDAPRTPQQIQVVSTLPADFTGQSFAAEIAVRPDGRFLYASNRGHNSIACYAIEADGQLTLVGFSATGHNPRHFTFDPTGRWLLVANQGDHSITVFAVDTQSGALTQSHQLQNVPGEPVCLLFLKPQPGEK